MQNTQESLLYIQDKLDNGDFNSREEAIVALMAYRYGQSESPGLGTIVCSPLPFSLFSASYGQNGDFLDAISKWAPCDGRSVAASIYAFINMNSDRAPDLRGVFVRALNIQLNDGKAIPETVQEKQADPCPNRLPEDFQVDDLKSHMHNLPHPLDSIGHTVNGNGHRLRIDADDGKPWHNLSWPGRTENSGGNETRPKNRALYYYIRIN